MFLVFSLWHLTNVAAISAPHDQQQEAGASDVQQMQQLVCGLTFEDTLNDAHTGDEMDLRSTHIHSFILQPHPSAGHTCCHPLQVSSEDKQWWLAADACEGVRPMPRHDLHAEQCQLLQR